MAHRSPSRWSRTDDLIPLILAVSLLSALRPTWASAVQAVHAHVRRVMGRRFSVTTLDLSRSFRPLTFPVVYEVSALGGGFLSCCFFCTFAPIVPFLLFPLQCAITLTCSSARLKQVHGPWLRSTAAAAATTTAAAVAGPGAGCFALGGMALTLWNYCDGFPNLSPSQCGDRSALGLCH